MTIKQLCSNCGRELDYNEQKTSDYCDECFDIFDSDEEETLLLEE